MKCWSVKSRFIAIMFTHLAIKHIFRCKSTPGNHLAYRAPQLLIICIKCSFLASCSQMGDLDKNGFLSRMITIPMSLICQALYIQPPPPDPPQPIPDPSPTPPDPNGCSGFCWKLNIFLACEANQGWALLFNTGKTLRNEIQNSALVCISACIAKVLSKNTFKSGLAIVLSPTYVFSPQGFIMCFLRRFGMSDACNLTMFISQPLIWPCTETESQPELCNQNREFMPHGKSVCWSFDMIR